MHDLLIGVGISTAVGPRVDPLSEALAAERFGFDFVSASDHPVGTAPTVEAVTLLTWVAARTSRIRVASRVLGVPFRRPATLAKTAESLHRLSDHRLILGLGGGYCDDEIRAVGAPAHSPRDKVDGLADAIEIVRRVWSAPEVTYAGKVHAVHDLTVTPRPDTPIPIWLGTYGNRALAVTGRLADGWIPSLGFAPPERVPELLDRVRTAAVAAGRSPDAVRAIYNVPVALGTTPGSAADVVSGSPSEVVEQLLTYVELGFTGFNFVVDPQQVPRIAAEVLPQLRG